MRGCYLGNNRVLINLAWGGKLIANSLDLSITPDLIINGVYDVPLTNFMLKNLKNGQTFIDVGANIGLFTVLAGSLVGNQGIVYGFEANISNYSILMDNLSMNYLNNHVKAFNYAIYSEKTRLTFHATTRFLGNSSLTPHDDDYKKRYQVENFISYDVDTISLDEALNNIPYVDLLKMDIEGGEYHAFLGLEKRLQSRTIGTIVFELNKTMLGSHWFPLYNRLIEWQENFGYTFGTISQQGEIVFAEIDELFMMTEIPAVVMSLTLP